MKMAESVELVPFMHLAHANVRLQKADDELEFFVVSHSSIKLKVR